MSAALLDTRSLGKPGTFSGKEVDWAHWHFVFSSWVAMLSAEMATEMLAASALEAPATSSDTEVVARSAQLFHMLVLMVKGRALEMMRAIGEKGVKNGYEAYRQLVQTYEPKTATRTMGLLHAVLSPTFSPELSKWMEELVIWEREVERYSAMSKERLPEAVLVATLTKGAPAAIRQHLYLQAATVGNDYQKAKQVIEGYIQATRVWSGAGASVPTHTAEAQEPVPMEVDAVKAGKHKGKYKGKEKGKDKGK